MSNGIKIDHEGRIRSTGTGRFLPVPDGVARVKVDDGVVFIFDFEEEEPLPKPTAKDIEKWGEWA